MLMCKVCDIERLRLLENAVIHYGGGITNLKKRSLTGIHCVNDSCPEVAKLLAEISNYLQGLIEDGELRKNYYFCNAEHYDGSTKSLVGS